MARIHDVLAVSHPKIERGRVWCLRCGRTKKVDPAACIRDGWPKCCGYTMTIDHPSERRTPDTEGET